MKKLFSIIFHIFVLVAIVILTIGIFILFGVIQEKLFVPKEYLMWIFKYPSSRLVFVYELYLLLGVFYIFNKGFINEMLRTEVTNSKNSFLKKTESFSVLYL